MGTIIIINPVNHAASVESIAIYKVEPYVVASDVYALSPHTGRGGWTWYSGSAGWMYRLILESILGLRREADKLHIRTLHPCTLAVVQDELSIPGNGLSHHGISNAGSGGRDDIDGRRHRAASTWSFRLIDDRQKHEVVLRIHIAQS